MSDDDQAKAVQFELSRLPFENNTKQSKTKFTPHFVVGAQSFSIQALCDIIHHRGPQLANQLINTSTSLRTNTLSPSF